MPNRIIKESICTSETVNKMSWFEECFFTRLITSCDDFGRTDARPQILKSRLFPLKDRISLKDIEDALQKLADIGCVTLYECDSKPYLYFPSWGVHQNVRSKKSKYPDPNKNGQSANICKQMKSHDSKCPRNPIQSESNPIQICGGGDAREEEKSFIDGLFQEYAGRTATGYDIQLAMDQIHTVDIHTMATTYSPALAGRLKYAFQEAVKAGKPGDWKYIGGILNKLDERGIQTAEQGKRYDIERRTEK